MIKAERNLHICSLYSQGKTVAELALLMSVTRERIRQILRKAGVLKKYRDMNRTNRDAFVGVDVKAGIKAALRDKAKEEGKSMSQLVSDAIEEIVK